ncbi:MAG: GyrI-like domain-containing protein [Methanomicrobiales archaeon]|nr:GyrI-like domain-containing protein [Methanomicrobiales archaeon]
MQDLSFKLTKRPEFSVVGVSRRTCNADGRSVADIPAVWQDFLSQNAAAKIKHRSLPPAMFAVYSDYEADWTKEYSFLIGCGVTRAPEVPQGMEVRRIPAQTYAHFVAKGDMPQCLIEIWSSVWLSNLPRTYTFDFEVYDQRFTRPKNKEIDIFVAVDPAKMEGVPGTIGLS